MPLAAAACGRAVRMGGLGLHDAEPGDVTMVILAAIRIFLGLTFAASGAIVLASFDHSVASFAAWSVPLPHVAVWVVGAVGIVCGGLLASGALVRPVSLLLATLAVGAAMTAGRHGGSVYAIVSPILFLGCVFFAWRSDRISVAGPSRPPGVQ